MKKFVAVLLTGLMMIGASACAAETLQASTAGAIAPEQAEKSPPVLDFEHACSPADADEMIKACGQLAAYLAISVYEIDMTQPDPEDFWLMLSLVTYGANPEYLSEFGTIDLTKEEVTDIAETFFSEWVAANGLPSTKDSYVAEYVAAESLYELQPMEISDMAYELISLDPIGGADGSFSMGIRLTDALDRTEKLEWTVFLKQWNDDEEHLFPCRFQSIETVENPAG